MTTQKYPEHEKLDKIQETSNSIGTFLEWLSSTKQIRFAKWDREVFVQQSMEIEKWLAEYFNIDLKKLEEEKQAMLKELRKLQEKKQ